MSDFDLERSYNSPTDSRNINRRDVEHLPPVLSGSGMCYSVGDDMRVDIMRHRYPFCIVWTPIPFLTWLCPVIGHMGIATSAGVIRDFAAPYVVSEDNMAFGWPAKYWQLSPTVARGGRNGWDQAVTEASNEYKTRMHYLCCDNCHSHVAMALNIMNYNSTSGWNMVKLALHMAFRGSYVSFGAWMKTWVPFLLLVLAITLLSIFV